MVLSPERNKNTEEKSNDVTHTAHYEVRETKESETLLRYCVCVNSHMRFKGEGSPFNSSNLTKRRRNEGSSPDRQRCTPHARSSGTISCRTEQDVGAGLHYLRSTLHVTHTHSHM